MMASLFFNLLSGERTGFHPEMTMEEFSAVGTKLAQFIMTNAPRAEKSIMKIFTEAFAPLLQESGLFSLGMAARARDLITGKKHTEAQPLEDFFSGITESDNVPSLVGLVISMFNSLLSKNESLGGVVAFNPVDSNELPDGQLFVRKGIKELGEDENIFYISGKDALKPLMQEKIK